jgi:hypothetical protein
MRSLAEPANLLATRSGFWKRQLLGAKPIAVCPLRSPSRTGLGSLTSDGQLGSNKLDKLALMGRLGIEYLACQLRMILRH